MIELGAMAGTGKTAHAAIAHSLGQPEGAVAVDDGLFRESLKASVGTAAAVPAAAVTATRPAAAEITAKSAAEAPAANELADDAKAQVPGGVGKSGVEPAAEAKRSDVVEVKAAKLDGATAKSLVSKSAKSEGVAGEKKTVTKEETPAQGGAAVQPEVATGTAVGVVVPVAATAAAAAETVTSASAKVDAVQAAVAPVAIGGSAKGTKVAGASGAGKAAGREAKRVDGGAAAGTKSSGVAAATPVMGGGSGLTTGKDGAPVVAVQGGMGVAAVTPAGGTMVSHAAVAGVAGAKVAASVDGVIQAGGQANAQIQEVKTLAATPNLLEVGIESGTHGWLRVRAELGQTGEVTASMVASSAGQADTLRRELPAMSTYLAAESVGVSSLVVNAAGASAGAQDAAMNLGAGAQGGGDDRAQGSGVSPQSGGGGNAAGSNEDSGAVDLDFSGGELPSAVFANGSGSWLSVRV